MNIYWHIENDWTPQCGNIGDIINPHIVQKITGEFPTRKTSGGNRLLICGSILEDLQDGDSVWGIGFNKNIRFPVRKNIQFFCIRGELTYKKLLECGYNPAIIPKLFGDPCIITKELFGGKFEEKYPLGIIPHYVDQPFARNIFKDCNLHFINIINSVNKFIEEINKCEIILSSSLHGIIISESYGKKAIPIQIGHRVTGGFLKFKDYYSSTERNPLPINIYEPITERGLLKLLAEYNYEYPVYDRRKLMDSCPFGRIPHDQDSLHGNT